MTLVKSQKIEHQYELGNGSYAQIDPTGGLTVYNEDNIVVLSDKQTEVLKYALGFYDLPAPAANQLLREVRASSVLMTPNDILQRIDALLTPAQKACDAG